MSENKRRRISMMMWAHITFHMRKVPQANREVASWLYLIEWARLGGRPDDVLAATPQEEQGR